MELFSISIRDFQLYEEVITSARNLFLTVTFSNIILFLVLCHSRVQLPYVIGNLHIQKLAGYFLVRHQYAFTLAWDGTSAVYIKMASEYLGKTYGLCGNNNAVLQDDLETSYGEYLRCFLLCNMVGLFFR